MLVYFFLRRWHFRRWLLLLLVWCVVWTHASTMGSVFPFWKATSYPLVFAFVLLILGSPQKRQVMPFVILIAPLLACTARDTAGGSGRGPQDGPDRLLDRLNEDPRITLTYKGLDLSRTQPNILLAPRTKMSSFH